MYTLRKNPITETIDRVITFDGIIKTSIPFDPANTDYQQFKRDVTAGAELQDADGVAMTHDAAVAFIKTLP